MKDNRGDLRGRREGGLDFRFVRFLGFYPIR